MLEAYGIDVEYIIIGLIIATLILLIISIILVVSNIRLKKRYKAFMGDSSGKALEERLIYSFRNLEAVMEENKAIKAALKKLNNDMRESFTKIGIVHYDAFDETTGKLSFVVALLNDRNNGVIINSVYSIRSGCYVYAKEIINGESYKVLTEEEKVALEEANKNIINNWYNNEYYIWRLKC